MSTSILSITIPLAGFLLFGAPAAMAVCTPGATYVRYVGDTASNPECTDNDIQSAINHTECPNTIIVITREHTYTAQHLDINNKSLTLIGKPDGVACGEQIEPIPPPSPQVAISGAGHSGDSVIYIHGDSNVTLQYLSIEGGSNLGGYGGGIHFDGTGSLVLDMTYVKNNVADYGGGINFTGSGGPATLTLAGYNQVISNSAAGSGGGIRMDGQSFLSATHDNILIALNHAPDGYGGGINIVGPAHADIASPGFGVGVVYSNDAKYGGGIAITSSGDDDAKVNLFTADSSRPVRITDNFAWSSGGAFYLKGNVGTIGSFTHSVAILCALDFHIDNNSAAEGSAIHADYDSNPTYASGGQVYLNNCGGLPPSARRCAFGVPCNTINGNVASDDQSNATLGATIRVGDASKVLGNRFAMQGNLGGYAIRSSGDAGEARVSNCLQTNNQLTRQLVNAGGGYLEINNCTLANNAILSTDTIHAEGGLTLVDSIIDQPGNLALAYSGGAPGPDIRYVLSTDVSTLPGITGIMAGAPTYVNAANGDYHLQMESLGVDYAPMIAGDDRDLDNFLRDQDLPQVINSWGGRDLGAYERQRTFACSVNDTIFCHGFEDS
jgi:predicted outer membrane repeat protein